MHEGERTPLEVAHPREMFEADVVVEQPVPERVALLAHEHAFDLVLLEHSGPDTARTAIRIVEEASVPGRLVLPAETER